MLKTLEWNAIIRNLARLRVEGGIGILTCDTGSGQIVSADPRYREWRHPWHVRLRWDGSLESWVATVRAGFVNGVVPTVVEALPDEDGAIDRDRPLDLSRGILLDAWLGYGRANAGVQSARVPDYFLRRGVVETESLLAQLLDGGPIKREDRQPGERLLLSCDIVLHQPRPGVRIESTVLDPLTDAAGLQMSPTIATPRDRTPFLRAVAQMPPDTPPDPLEILMGTYQEPLEDTLHIARVYLLSPPDQVDPTPTAEWSPIVSHKVFWNLAHAPRHPELEADEPLHLDVPLLSGITQPLINALLSGPNDAANQITTFVGTSSMAGAFWTA